jgi:hypothetical protein
MRRHWNSLARADTFTLRDASFSYSILDGTPVAQ